MGTCSIGGLSQATGCKIETIRYYERIGIMPSPPRTPGGHRLYDTVHLQRLSFIRRSRDLRFTVDEIRELLGLVDGQRYTCEQVKAVALRHLEEVRGKLRALQNLETTLDGLAKKCTGKADPECPFVDALFSDPRRQTTLSTT